MLPALDDPRQGLPKQPRVDRLLQAEKNWGSVWGTRERRASGHAAVQTQRELVAFSQRMDSRQRRRAEELQRAEAQARAPAPPRKAVANGDDDQVRLFYTVGSACGGPAISALVGSQRFSAIRFLRFLRFLSASSSGVLHHETRMYCCVPTYRQLVIRIAAPTQALPTGVCIYRHPKPLPARYPPYTYDGVI